MKNFIKNIFIVSGIIILFIICFFNTIKISKLILEYTELFIKRLFPVSFIFFTLSNILIEYNFFLILNKIFKIKSVYLYVFILSLISGFPNGAVIIKDLLNKNIIDLRTANKMIMFCHFPNPLFVINTVSILINKRIAFIILLSIVVGNLIIFIFIHKEKINFNVYKDDNKTFTSVLTNSIFKSFRTLIIIYGFSLFFYIIAFFISNLFINNTYIFVFINGLFDLTKGCFFTSLISNTYIRSIYILFFIVFGSISIHMQIKSILVDTCISYNMFILGRIIGFIITIICFLLLI